MYLINQPSMMLSEIQSLLNHLNVYRDTSIVQFFQANLIPYSTTHQVIRLEFKIFSLGRPIGMMTLVDAGNEDTEALFWDYASSKILQEKYDPLPSPAEILTIFKNLGEEGGTPSADFSDDHHLYPTELLETLGVTEVNCGDEEEDEEDEDEEDEEDEDDY